MHKLHLQIGMRYASSQGMDDCSLELVPRSFSLS
jgi:hypothetical protein